MSKQSTALQVLVLLCRAASRGLVLTETRLAEQLEVAPKELERVLRALDSEGFVDRERLRLTLPGLAVAVATMRQPKARQVKCAA